MKHIYGEYDGSPFPTPDSLFPPEKVMQLILQFGDEAMDALNHLDAADADPDELIEQLIEAGLMERDESAGGLRLTPKMVRAMGHKSLLEIFGNLERAGTRPGHETRSRGRSDERADGSRAYEFGDPLSELDASATLRNALSRARGEAEATGSRPLDHLKISPGDLEVHQTESQTDTATCLLLDMSGSMMRYGRFLQAKRVALGLSELIRQKFALDTLDVVGFYSLARVLSEQELPLVMPQPVSIFDSSVRLRMPLEQAQQPDAKLPLHFTNLQLGLRTARRLLARRGAANKQIFIVTDGQPTGHIETGPTGEEMLYLLYPPSEQTRNATLKEALRCRQAGIRIASFALIEDYWAMDWVRFIEQMTRLVKGIAFYNSSEDLGSTVIESYLSGRKRKSSIA